MGVLEVLFHVPPAIEAGLSSGAFQRVGGVIREVGSGQVVAWLREGGLETVGQLASAPMNPLGAIFQAAQLASSIYDKAVTRSMIQALSASVQTVTTLSSLTLGGQLLNLALSGVTLVTINKRLGAINKQLESMEAKLLAEFEQDRVVKFDVALGAAKDFFESKKGDARSAAYRSAVEGLETARKHFMFNFEKAMEKAPNRNHLTIAQAYLIKAMYAETVRIRCYWAMEEDEIARKRFREAMPMFERAIEQLIKEWLGKKSSVYFHKDVPKENLARYFRIQQRLRGVTVGDDPYIMFEIIDEMRSQFWDEDVLQDNIFRKITRTGGSVISRKEGAVIDAEQNSRLADNLLQAELLIENFERLLGFELEMAEARLGFQEWENLVSEKDLEEHGGALIVDSDMLERLQIEQ